MSKHEITVNRQVRVDIRYGCVLGRILAENSIVVKLKLSEYNVFNNTQTYINWCRKLVLILFVIKQTELKNNSLPSGWIKNQIRKTE